MTWLGGIKIYATLSLLFSAAWAFVGYRHNKRRAEAKAEYRFWSSRVIDMEPLQPIIRADGDLIL